MCGGKDSSQLQSSITSRSLIHPRPTPSHFNLDIYLSASSLQPHPSIHPARRSHGQNPSSSLFVCPLLCKTPKRVEIGHQSTNECLNIGLAQNSPQTETIEEKKKRHGGGDEKDRNARWVYFFFKKNGGGVAPRGLVIAYWFRVPVPIMMGGFFFFLFYGCRRETRDAIACGYCNDKHEWKKIVTGCPRSLSSRSGSEEGA